MGNYGRYPVSFCRGEGCWIWDEDGKKYLDFGAGIAVCSLGHSPACMREVLADQSAKLIHCSNLYHNPWQADLAEFLVEKTVQLPGKVFFANSGAEINDAAFKLARKFFYDQAGGKPDRYEVITCNNSFHGRTIAGIAATGQEKVKAGFEPIIEGFRHVPFNDCEALREAVSEKTAAVMLEPLQGEGGIHSVSPGYLKAAAELRDKFGCLIMFDEVQCGIGRTGDWCSWRSFLNEEVSDFQPDVMTWAKGIAGGFPMGAMWAADHCAATLNPGSHGSTFGGTPLASAVALAVLREIDESGCIEAVPQREQFIRDRVAEWDFTQISELRGAGLMLGFVLDTEAIPESKEPLPSIFLVKELMSEGLLTVPAGPGVVRWLPPLNVTEAEIAEALRIMEETLTRLST